MTINNKTYKNRKYKSKVSPEKRSELRKKRKVIETEMEKKVKNIYGMTAKKSQGVGE